MSKKIVSVPIYIINLDRSKQRYQEISALAEKEGLIYRRIAAIDGKTINIANCKKINEQSFRLLHGKIILTGEAGCYLSHLQALETIANGQEEHAIIVEDDIEFPAGFAKSVEELRKIEGYDIIKLVNHRYKIYHEHMKINDNLSLGRFLHGPLGSAAAYMVTKKGAAKLLQKLQPMKLPFDVALERGWTGFQFFSTRCNLVNFQPDNGSTILTGGDNYKKSQLPNYQRIGTFFFRLYDYICRILYALWPSKLIREK